MGLFDKKKCSLCGEKAGSILARKLSDGYICTKCYDSLSPFTIDHEKLSADDARAQIKARKENQKKLKEFQVTKAWGVKKDKKAMQFIYDADHRWFVVVEGPENTFRDRNPDIISFDQAKQVTLEIDEGWTDAENKFGTRNHGLLLFEDHDEVCWQYDFYLTIKVDHPYIKKIRYQMNAFTTKVDAPKDSLFYRQGLELDGKYTGEKLRELARRMKAAEEADQSYFEKFMVFSGWVLGDDSFESYQEGVKFATGHILRAERIQRLLGV